MTPDPTSSRKPLVLPPQRDGSHVTSAPLLSPFVSAPSKGFNPLLSKVTTVLSTSYADSEFREALALLDARGIENTAETRRQLRLDLQKEVIDSNGDVVDEFGKVAEQLRRIGTIVEKLNAVHSDMRNQINAAHEVTSGVLEEASSLMTQKHQVEAKQHLLRAFREKFVLSEDEIAILTLTSEPVNDDFFAVVAKAKQIVRDCEVLLGFEKQTLGLELMEQTSKNLNHGFQKLYRWIQREFKGLDLENPQIGAAIRRALRVLAERPTLFQNCLNFFAEAREHILSDAFYTALTGSSAAGAGSTHGSASVKPIELAAHDPLRYVGDMLAWAHSAAVGEREALEVLFISEGDEIAKGIRAGRENERWKLMAENEDHETEAAEFDPVTALNELVDRDMSGAARILRQRVEQVIQTNEETILAYKLANLLNFYKATFTRLLDGEDSVMVECLASLEVEALRQFRSLMRDHIATLQGEFQQTPADLGVPDFLQDALEQLTAIMQTYETSFATAAVSGADREANFRPVLVEAFDPFMAGCENMARQAAGTSNTQADSIIFLINCLLSAQHVLSRFEFAQGRARQLAARVDEEAGRLAESQYLFFRTASGLDALIETLAHLDPEKLEDVMRAAASGSDSDPELEAVLSPTALTLARQMLDNFLPSALMDAVERVHHLQDARLAREITEAAAERFCVDFEHVEALLIAVDEMADQDQDREDGEEDGETPQSLRALFPRTTGEIRVLLS